MSLNPGILPAFEQLGMLDELLSFSKLALENTFYTDKMKPIAKMQAIDEAT